MMIDNALPLSERMVSKYLDSLVNRFYKILPLKEANSDTLNMYVSSLLREMTGVGSLVSFLDDDDRYLSLLAILQFFADHDTDVAVVRTEVFRAISVIKKLQSKYCTNAG